MSTAALFTAAKVWNRSIFPLIEGWTKTAVYTHTGRSTEPRRERRYTFAGSEHATENSIQREKCDVSALVRRAGTKDKKGKRRAWN